MSKRLAHVFSLAAAILFASASVRCVSESPGIAVELVFAAPDGYEGDGASVTGAAAFVVAATLVPCPEPTRATWHALTMSVARAHTESSSGRTWVGAERVDVLSVDGEPLGLLSPAAGTYCQLEVTFAPDDSSENDPREDPMVGRSLGVEGHYLQADGSLAPFAVRTSRERVELVPFDAPLVLDDARDLARVTVSFDARRWAAGMNFEGLTAGEQREALLTDLHVHLAATVDRSSREP